MGSRYIVSVLGLFPPSVVKTMPHCFLLHLFFSKLVYILESALYQRCMELLNLCCVTFHNNTFLFSTFIFKKKWFKDIRGALSVVQFFFTCQNLSKIILLTKMLMGKQNIWKSIVVKKKMKTQWYKWFIAILWSRLIGHISEVLITVLK